VGGEEGAVSEPRADVREQVKAMAHKVHELEREANALLHDARVRITSQGYNGQPWGQSRPSLKGREYSVTFAYLDSGDVWLALDGPRVTISIDDVVIVRVGGGQP
jgi:hypothetical protein